jgi:hypothetical protein
MNVASSPAGRCQGEVMGKNSAVSVLVMAGAVVFALTGCTTGPHGTATASTPATPAPNTSTSTPQTSPSPDTASPVGSELPISPACGAATGQAAAAKGIAALPLPAGLSDSHWDAARADYTGYSACAALSWSVITVQGSTGSSPYAILLFNKGNYLGAATKLAYSFQPDVTRSNDNTLQVTYHYPKTGENDANLTGTTTATLTWDANTQKVLFAGTTPPIS